MEDEDIKIVEEWLKNRKETIDVCGIAMSDIFVSRTFALENLLSRLKTVERMNDVLASEIFYKLNDEYFEYGYSENEVKEWARKKVEDENNISRL